MRDVSMGQYYPVKSAVHRMDARAKIVFLIAYIVLLFLIPSIDGFLKKGGELNAYLLRVGIEYAILLIFLVVTILFSRVPPLKVLKSIKAVLFLVIFTAIIMFLFYNGSATHVYAEWWIIRISLEGIVSAVAMALRLFFLVMGPSILTLTTTPVELTDGIESLLKPLSYIKIPVHEIAIIMSIALRLIPTLIEEADKIQNAQKARCADFESGNIFKRAKAMIPVLVPLLVSSFRRADELAYAMDSRCYRGAKGRTRMKVMKLSYRDLIAFIVLLVVYFAVLILIYDFFGAASALCSLII